MCPNDFVVSLLLSDVFPYSANAVSSKTRSFQVLVAPLSVPAFLPAIHHVFNRYMVLDVNWGSILTVVYLAYYLTLEPTAAVSGLPSHWHTFFITDDDLAAAVRPSAHRVHADCNCLCAKTGPRSANRSLGACLFLGCSIHWPRIRGGESAGSPRQSSWR